MAVDIETIFTRYKIDCALNIYTTYTPVTTKR